MFFAAEYTFTVVLSVCASVSGFSTAAALQASLTTSDQFTVTKMLMSQFSTAGIQPNATTITSVSATVLEGCVGGTSGRRVATTMHTVDVTVSFEFSVSTPASSAQQVLLGGLASVPGANDSNALAVIVSSAGATSIHNPHQRNIHSLFWAKVSV